MSNLNGLFVVLLAALTVSVSSSDDQEGQIVEWLLQEGGYILNPEEKIIDTVQKELDLLKTSLGMAVEALINRTQPEEGSNVLGLKKSPPLVFNVGIVVDNKKLMHQIDFIQWSRQIGMRALALGKRYVGVSFQVFNIRNRLYIFFVNEKEATELSIAKGRRGLDAKIRELFENLKEIGATRFRRRSVFGR